MPVNRRNILQSLVLTSTTGQTSLNNAAGLINHNKAPLIQGPRGSGGGMHNTGVEEDKTKV